MNGDNKEKRNWTGLPGSASDELTLRRHTPALRFLMVFMLVSLPANWAYHLLIVRTPVRRDMTVDLAVDVLVWGTAWLCLLLIRRRAVKQAVAIFVGSMLLALAVMYLSIGLTRQMLDQTYPVLTIVLGGLILGRRALWGIYALIVLMMWGGGIVDVLTLTARAYPRPWLGAANAPSMSLSYFAITLVLDRCVYAMRYSLDEARRTSAELAALNNALQAEMLARAKTQDALIHSQKMDVVGRLSSGVAHDFNHILAVISGCAQNMLDRSDEAQQLDPLEGIVAATRRGSAISRKLLSFARQDTQHNEVFDAGFAAAGLASMLGQLFGSRITVRVDTPREPAPVFMDVGQFELVLLNLAANARDAVSGIGEFAISVDVVERAGLAAEVCIRVQDSGSGMSEYVRQRAFEPFFTTKPSGEGTGLGLSVVRDVVEQADGSIQAISAPDAGTTIEIRLPMIGTVKHLGLRHVVRVLVLGPASAARDDYVDALDDAGCVALAMAPMPDGEPMLAEAGDATDVALVLSVGDGAWLTQLVAKVRVLVLDSDAKAWVQARRAEGLDVHWKHGVDPMDAAEVVRAVWSVQPCHGTCQAAA